MFPNCRAHGFRQRPALEIACLPHQLHGRARKLQLRIQIGRIAVAGVEARIFLVARVSLAGGKFGADRVDSRLCHLVFQPRHIACGRKLPQAALHLQRAFRHLVTRHLRFLPGPQQVGGRGICLGVLREIGQGKADRQADGKTVRFEILVKLRVIVDGAAEPLILAGEVDRRIQDMGFSAGAQFGGYDLLPG